MNTERCEETIWDRSSWNHYQCQRKPGYGKDGLYCKQHAKKHPADDQETVTMYAVQWFAGVKLRLSRCQVFGVTDKTLIVKSAEAILGWSIYTPSQYARSGGDWMFFSTAREAIEWGAERAQRLVDRLNRDVALAEEELAALTKMLAAEDLGSKIDMVTETPQHGFVGTLTLD